MARNITITLTFDKSIDANLVNADNIVVRSAETGLVSGSFTGGDTQTVTFTPDKSFRWGDHPTLDGDSNQ